MRKEKARNMNGFYLTSNKNSYVWHEPLSKTETKMELSNSVFDGCVKGVNHMTVTMRNEIASTILGGNEQGRRRSKFIVRGKKAGRRCG